MSFKSLQYLDFYSLTLIYTIVICIATKMNVEMASKYLYKN